MQYLLSAILGYTLGCISPSYIIGLAKRVDMRSSGTKNLGASNTFLHFGRLWGSFVLLFDFFKAYLSVILCRIFFPALSLAPLLGGTAAVLGHIYPAELRFRGGKGLASLGGFILALEPILFLLLLTVCLVAALIANYGCVLALCASLLFPFFAGTYYGSLTAFLICSVCSASVFYKHIQNLRRIRRGEETKLSVFFGKYLLHFKKP